MANNLTPKQEKFAKNIFLGQTFYNAWLNAGYAKASRAIVDVSASRMARKPKINLRVQALKDLENSKLVDAKIMRDSERRERLSEFGRSKVDPERILPRDVISSIQELNKMDHLYDEKPQYNDNRQYNFIVQSKTMKAKVNQLLNGAPPKQIEQGTTIDERGDETEK